MRKSFAYYDEMCRDFFKFLYDQPKDQTEYGFGKQTTSKSKKIVSEEGKENMNSQKERSKLQIKQNTINGGMYLAMISLNNNKRRKSSFI